MKNAKNAKNVTSVTLSSTVYPRNYLALTTWMLSDSVASFLNFELPSVTLVNSRQL